MKARRVLLVELICEDPGHGERASLSAPGVATRTFEVEGPPMLALLLSLLTTSQHPEEMGMRMWILQTWADARRAREGEPLCPTCRDRLQGAAQ